MSHFAYTKEIEDELMDLHHGIHLVMENLINQKNYEEAERIIRQIDSRMSLLINKSKIAKLR